MPRKAPAEPIDHHYNIPRLNKALAWAGVLLLVAFVAMIVEDYARGWKRIQRTFGRLDARKTREQALEARKTAQGEERVKLRAELDVARKELRGERDKLRALNDRLRKIEPRLYLADQEYKFKRASFDAQRYQYEDALNRNPGGAPKEKEDLDELQKEVDAKTLRLAEVTREQTAVQSEIKKLTSRVEEINASIERLTSDYRLAAQKYAGLQEDALFKLRNAAILDMVNPSLRVQQVQLPDHFNNVNFMRIPRVDRCTTCHVAAERTGFVDAKTNTVFRSHPRMELMVGAESPHPFNLFGCTPCHGGRDRASSFWSAGHSPETPREEKRWAESFNWHFDRFNSTPVLPLKYTEAGCYRCHAGETNFREAPTLDAGMKLVEQLGCYGCHRIEGLEQQGPLPRVGPPLEKVASKVSKDWTTRWVMDPAAFRANTKMPTFFYLENFVDVSGEDPPTEAQKRMNEQGKVENDAMVNAIVAYLYEKSRPAVVPTVAGAGDAARGQSLLSERGCFGCHVADPAARRDVTGTYRQFGPNLSGVGSKVSRDWLYHWIRDPKAWAPDTKMPNLRLEHQEALDIAEYLSTLKEPQGFSSRPLPRTDSATLDRIALYFQMENKTLFDARSALQTMDLHAKEVYAGEKLIAHYGCFACHNIPGFEAAKPIGTELTEEGSKPIHRLDFGFIHLPHTRHDWFNAKLENPRIFDRDRARSWEEKYKMPDFRLSEKEKDQLVTAVLGFQEPNASPTAMKNLSGEEAAIERGRRIVKNNNCLGCHVIEGFGGSFRSLVADTSLAPPIIQGQGAKVQSDWLFRFLKAPRTGEIRPWLEVHMPTFGFQEEELNDLARYFALLDRARFPFLATDQVAETRSWSAGKKVFELLRCAQCHPRNETEMNAPGVDRASLAPNLQMSSTRLRHDWIADWIKRPDEWMPGTRMPTNFPKGEDGKRVSPLGGMLDAPSFAADRAEFARILGSDEEARRFLSDPDAVTKALRDYVWSLGGAGVPQRAPAETGPNAGAQRAFGAPPAVPAPPRASSAGDVGAGVPAPPTSRGHASGGRPAVPPGP